VKLELTRDASLPGLAWSVCWDSETDRVTLLAGDGVEVGDDRWVEGAWSGPFSGLDPSGAWLAGSAGRLGRDGLTLQPSFHSYDGLYAIRRGRRVHASNSLAFLLEASGARLRTDYPRYLTEFARVIDGLPAHRIHVPLAGGETLELHHLLSVTFHRDGGETFGVLPEVAPFVSYDDYVSFLEQTCRSIVENGRSTDRRRPFRPLATVSSGYDSPAVAVIARACGTHEAVTIAQARDGRDRSTLDDSGVDVATALGLSLVAVPRDARWSVAGDPVVAEFLATGMSGEEVPFRRLSDQLTDRILFTGFYGDKVWGRSVGTDARLLRVELGGSSFTELRLRANFVHLPVPMLGAMSHPSIAGISVGPELEPWSVGGAYDRPIARRIAERAGVPREAFGHSKRAVSVLTGRERIVDRAVRSEVLAFRQQQASGRDRLVHLGSAVAERVLRDPVTLVARVLTRVGVLARGHRGSWMAALRRRSTLRGSLSVWAFLWAVDRIGGERYRGPSAALRDVRD
jgi:hypothetical protein